MFRGPTPPCALETGDHVWKHSFFERQGSVRIERCEFSQQPKEGLELTRTPGRPHSVVEGKLIRENEDAQVGDSNDPGLNATENRVKRLGLETTS